MNHPPLGVLFWLVAACSARPTPSPTPTPPPPLTPVFAQRPTMAEANATFAAAGVQPGQPLPTSPLLELDGTPCDLRTLQAGRPLLLVTCSLTCNVARRQQAKVTALQQRFGDAAAIVMVYTIDAHPSGEPCPYTGTEWVPPANAQDDVLVGQPTTLATRLALAQRYARQWAGPVRVLVDGMDDAAWLALGRAPNVGVCVDADGLVQARTGWFDADALATTLQRLVP